MKPFTVTKQNDAIVIKTELVRRKDWEQWFYIQSDVHCDNKKYQKNLHKKHLDLAIERNAIIIDNGDYFDCMGGKYDGRSNKADILPELQTDKYFDSLVKYGVNILEPYKNNIAIMGDGNHELSVKDRHEIDLTERLIDRLENPNILRQKYAGFIVLRFVEGNRCYNTIIYRTHGNGGNAPVTKGVIQSARRQDMIEADIYISGHIHTEYNLARPKWCLDNNYNVQIKNPVHQQIGTYKDSTFSTWEDMKGFAPPSLGGKFLKFWYEDNKNYKGIRFRFENCD